MKQLNVGCGVDLLPNFVNIDKYIDIDEARKQQDLPDDVEFLQADVLDLPFEDDEFDYIECIDVLEHLPFLDVIPAIKEMRRVLKPQTGTLLLCTTNFTDIAKAWLDMENKIQLSVAEYQEILEVVYGNQVHEGEYHKTGFTPRFLHYCFSEAGFVDEDITMTAYPKGSVCPKLRGSQYDPNGTFRASSLFVDTHKR